MGETEAEMCKQLGEGIVSLPVWLEEFDWAVKQIPTQLLLRIKCWGCKEGKAWYLPLSSSQSGRRARFCT